MRRSALFFSTLVVAALGAALSAAPERPFTLDDILSFKTVRGIAVSPDARAAVVLVVAANAGERRFDTELWLVPLDDKAEPRQLTFTAGSEFAAAWSPDGGRLAFIARRGDVPQVYVLPMSGGEARPYANLRAPVSAFCWAPDGKRMAVVAPAEDNEADARRRREGDDEFVVGRQWRNSRVWLVAEGGLPAPLTDPRRHVRVARWSPDGKWIGAVTTPDPEADSAEEARAEIIDVETGKAQEVPGSGRASDIAWSPDGGLLLVVRPFDGNGISREDLFIWPLRGQRMVDLTREIDRDVERVFWRSRDRIQILYSLGTRSALSTIDTTGRILDTWEPGFALSDVAPGAGDTVLFAGGGAPDELQIRADGTTRTLTRWNADRASAVALPVFETVRWRSTSAALEGVLIRPATLEPGRRYPLIVNPHGGPRGHSSELFDPQAAYFVSQGYLVFRPNFRGSTGYGDAFARANVANWGEGPLRDVLTGVESLMLRGIVDPARLYIYGWSYGGYLTNWAVTHTDQFRAAASGAGVADLTAQYAISDARRWRFDYFVATPFTAANQPLYDRESPITYARYAKTPTLFLHGERDERCPLAQGLLMYRALKDSGTESEMVVYPREPHGFAEPAHVTDRARRIVEWFRAHEAPPRLPATR